MTHSHDADIAVLAVLNDNSNVSAVEERLRDLAYDTMLEHGAVFSIHGVTESTLQHRADHPCFHTVLEESRPLYGSHYACSMIIFRFCAMLDISRVR